VSVSRSRLIYSERVKQAAYLLSDFADALIESDMAVDVVAEIVVRTSPIIMEYAMKGVLNVE
jgi:hypothetical protein